MVCPAAVLVQDIAEIAFWIYPVEPRRLNQGVDRRRPLAALVRTCEEIILPAERDAAHGVLGDVVVRLQTPVGEEEGQRLAPLERVAEGLGELGLRR